VDSLPVFTMVSVNVAFRRALKQLERSGILLESDARLPSVVTIVTGGPVRGSWWGHPQGREVYAVCKRLVSHSDVIVTKLVSGKVTYVHRRLWPALVAIGSAREIWQVRGLSRAAQDLLALVDKAHEVRTDRVCAAKGMKTRSIGDAVRELEARLLVHSIEIHTEFGAHAKQLQTWNEWRKEVGLVKKANPPQLAKKTIEKLVLDLNLRFAAKGRLPWVS